MRILHIADLHLGAKNSKLPKIKQDLLKDEMIENVHHLFGEVGKDFDVCLICGDLFHSKSVAAKIVDSFFKAVEIFAKPVLYISGNHDEKLILDHMPANFIMLDEKTPSFKYADCVFYCKEGAKNIDNTKNSILLLHGNIENPQDNDYVDINQYLPLNFDYVALGHTHLVKKFKKADHIFAYSGSLFSNGFDECGDKGYIDLEIADKKVAKCEFKSLKQRRYMICEYDISTDETNAQISEGIKERLAQIGITKNDIVRVILKGYYQEFVNKSLAIIEENFVDYFYFELQDESKLKIDLSKIKTETLSLKNEFISLVEHSDLSDEVKAKVINLGIEALKGDDLSL